jgi:NAD(P)-dependent dehydrogenase (short-subunit alcohol dehydrogenase family)
VPARPNFPVYSATKTPLVRFTESLAEEIGEHNVQVNCISPGASYTVMTDHIVTARDRAG